MGVVSGLVMAYQNVCHCPRGLNTHPLVRL